MRRLKSLWSQFGDELDRYPTATMCFSISAVALVAAVIGGLFNYFLAELLAVLGIAILGLFYLALGIWHRVVDIPVSLAQAMPVRADDTLEWAPPASMAGAQTAVEPSPEAGWSIQPGDRGKLVSAS